MGATSYALIGFRWRDDHRVTSGTDRVPDHADRRPGALRRRGRRRSPAALAGLLADLDRRLVRVARRRRRRCRPSPRSARPRSCRSPSGYRPRHGRPEPGQRAAALRRHGGHGWLPAAARRAAAGAAGWAGRRRRVDRRADRRRCSGAVAVAQRDLKQLLAASTGRPARLRRPRRGRGRASPAASATWSRTRRPSRCCSSPPVPGSRARHQGPARADAAPPAGRRLVGAAAVVGLLALAGLPRCRCGRRRTRCSPAPWRRRPRCTPSGSPAPRCRPRTPAMRSSCSCAPLETEASTTPAPRHPAVGRRAGAARAARRRRRRCSACSRCPRSPTRCAPRSATPPAAGVRVGRWRCPRWSPSRPCSPSSSPPGPSARLERDRPRPVAGSRAVRRRGRRPADAAARPARWRGSTTTCSTGTVDRPPPAHGAPGGHRAAARRRPTWACDGAGPARSPPASRRRAGRRRPQTGPAPPVLRCRPSRCSALLAVVRLVRCSGREVSRAQPPGVPAAARGARAAVVPRLPGRARSARDSRSHA